MPAVSVQDRSTLRRVPAATGSAARPVDQVVAATYALEGAGFGVWRPFPGVLSMTRTDPFLLLDQMGPTDVAPGEAKGAPWHPHRGFETVTYVLDGEMVHHDSHGGGGVIGEGDTQWMTAGAGVLHDEVPGERMVRDGGRSHGVQLWVNLPAASKMVEPNYQLLRADDLVLLTSDDGHALVRLIAGSIGDVDGPGSTHTPITYAHATVDPGGRIEVPWTDETAMAYVLSGRGTAGPGGHPVREHDLVLFGPGDSVVVTAAAADDGGHDEPLDVLLLGGRPIREPIAHHGPFVMNTREEIVQAVEDFQAGKMGAIPDRA